MSHFNSKTKYFKHLEHRLRDASSNLQKLKGKEITTYADRSTIANADGYSLSIVKSTLSDKCFEHIKLHKLDLNNSPTRLNSGKKQLKNFLSIQKQYKAVIGYKKNQTDLLIFWLGIPIKKMDISRIHLKKTKNITYS